MKGDTKIPGPKDIVLGIPRRELKVRSLVLRSIEQLVLNPEKGVESRLGLGRLGLEANGESREGS